MVVESANQNSNRQICAKREKCRKHDGLPDCIITFTSLGFIRLSIDFPSSNVFNKSSLLISLNFYINFRIKNFPHTFLNSHTYKFSLFFAFLCCNIRQMRAGTRLISIRSATRIPLLIIIPRRKRSERNESNWCRRIDLIWTQTIIQFVALTSREIPQWLPLQSRVGYKFGSWIHLSCQRLTKVTPPLLLVFILRQIASFLSRDRKIKRWWCGDFNLEFYKQPSKLITLR